VKEHSWVNGPKKEIEEISSELTNKLKKKN
jgi:hypothetical protein